jgi:hypothetical protein
MSSLAQLVCLFCLSVPSLPYPQVSREAGDIRYTYEMLGRDKVLLRLSTESSFLFAERDRVDRLYAFADAFARNACPADYRFLEQRRVMPPIHPALSRNFVFRCLPRNRSPDAIRDGSAAREAVPAFR